jgi:hypothetical protein
MGPSECAFKSWKLMTAVTLVPTIGVAACCYACVAATVGYPIRDRDWNLDGETTVAEFFAAADVGVRPLACGEESCVEYFLFKDGVMISIVCPGLGPAVSCP